MFFVLLIQKEHLQTLLVFWKCDVAQHLRMLRYALTSASQVCVRLEKIAWLASLLLVSREKHHECGVKGCRVALVFSTKICHIFEKLLRGDTQWTQRHKITMSCAMKCEENRAGSASWSKTCYLLKSYIVCLNMPVCFISVWSHFSVATEIHKNTTFERRTFIYLRS